MASMNMLLWTTYPMVVSCLQLLITAFPSLYHMTYILTASHIHLIIFQTFARICASELSITIVQLS